MKNTIQRLSGANMDIDLVSPPGDIAWHQDVHGIQQSKRICTAAQ
jgi:hypothetical protein